MADVASPFVVAVTDQTEDTLNIPQNPGYLNLLTIWKN